MHSRYHASSISGAIHSRCRHLRRFQIPCIPHSMHQSFQVPCIPGIFSSQTFPFIPDTSQPPYHIPCIPDTMHSRYHAPCIPGTMHQVFHVPCIPGIVSSKKLPYTCIPGTMHHAFQLSSTSRTCHLGSEAIFKLRKVLTTVRTAQIRQKKGPNWRVELLKLSQSFARVISNLH